jgi:integrase
MTLFQPTWKLPDGAHRRGKVWWWEGAVAGKRYRFSLGVRDRHAAQARAAEVVRRLELEAAGLPVGRAPADASPTVMIEEYEAELVRRGSAPQHVRRTVQRLRDLLARAARLAEVTPEALRAALQRVASSGVAPQTVNAYRVAAHSFFAWLVREEKWPGNPVDRVARVRAGEPTRVRRALTADELSRLVATAGRGRGPAYLLAATTGLRRSELASLTWEDVDLEAATVRVRARSAKNRREAVLPLPAGTVAALGRLRGDEQLPTAKVLRSVPNTTTMRKDLTRARIPFATPDGVIDLHSLRVTYGTLLARAGVSLAQAQKLMRHSTPVLTANVYVKLQMDDAREAVARIDVGGGAESAAAPPRKVASR